MKRRCALAIVTVSLAPQCGSEPKRRATGSGSGSIDVTGTSKVPVLCTGRDRSRSDAGGIEPVAAFGVRLRYKYRGHRMLESARTIADPARACPPERKGQGVLDLQIVTDSHPPSGLDTHSPADGCGRGAFVV